MSIYLIEGDSKTYDEAMISIDVIFWKEAIKREVDSIVSNHTWGLYGLTEGCKAIGSKWIFKKKQRHDCTIDKYKARLVIRGFNQKKGVDYFNIYSPMTKTTTLELLLLWPLFMT